MGLELHAGLEAVEDYPGAGVRVVADDLEEDAGAGVGPWRVVDADEADRIGRIGGGGDGQGRLLRRIV
jgi:hypothetical protein